MKKRTAKRNFIAIAIVAVVALVLTFCSFNIPFTHYTYNGLIGGMPLGYDLGEGVTAFYTTEQNANYEGDYESNLNSVVTEFNKFLSKSFNEFLVTKTENGIKVQVPNTSDSAGVLEIISGAGSIEFKTEESDTAAASITGENIKSTKFAVNEGVPGVLITFTDEGEDLFYNLTTAQAGKSIYIYIGGKLFFSPSVSEGIPGGVTFISGNMNSEFEAQGYAFKMTASLLGVNMDLEGDVVTQQALLGEHAIIYLAIIGGIIFALTLLFLILKYKHLGLIGSLTLALQFSVLMLALNLMGTVQLTLASVLGMALAFLLSVFNIVIYFEKIHAQFKTGKKIPISIKIANKNALITILDVNAPIFVSGVLLSWLISGIVKSFSIPLTVGVLLSVGFTLLILRGLVRMYQYTNISKFSKYGFDKSEVESEIN